MAWASDLPIQQIKHNLVPEAVARRFGRVALPHV